MRPTLVSLGVLAVVFGGSVIAMSAARAVPESHLAADSRDVIKLGMAVISTLVALVLGLMIATAKAGYDSQSTAARQLSANILLLDRTLAAYGDAAAAPRQLLREAATATYARLWPTDGSAPASLAPGESHAQMMSFVDEVAALAPSNGVQALLKAEAEQRLSRIAETRFDMYTQGGSSLPVPFLIIVVVWLVVLFAGIGLIAPRNLTVLAFLLAAAVSVSAAVFLIEELADPFAGVIRVSAEPMRQVLGQLGG
jgi:uncharacterized membrane protein